MRFFVVILIKRREGSKDFTGELQCAIDVWVQYVGVGVDPIPWYGVGGQGSL